MRGFWYLATPYSRYPHGLEAAFRAASRAAAKFIAAGVPVFSPIAHTHPIAKEGMLDLLDLSMWLKVDEPMMRAAVGLIVVEMESWDDSKGVAHEIEVFEKADKPVLFWDPTHPVPPGIIEWRCDVAKTPSDLLCQRGTGNRRGTNTGNGHVWERPDGMKARCGGPGMCKECSRDQAQLSA